jgi:hypothetical protein
MIYPTPVNRIVVQGMTLFSEFNAGASTIKPGYLVMKGSTDDDVLICDGSTHNPTGWAGYEQASPDYKPANISTAYNTGDRLPVVSCKGGLVLATLATSQTIVNGDALACGTSSNAGMVVAATKMIVTSGSATASAVSATQPTVTGSAAITGTRVVGYAAQSVTTTSSTSFILVRSDL